MIIRVHQSLGLVAVEDPRRADYLKTGHGVLSATEARLPFLVCNQMSRVCEKELVHGPEGELEGNAFCLTTLPSIGNHIATNLVE